MIMKELSFLIMEELSPVLSSHGVLLWYIVISLQEHSWFIFHWVSHFLLHHSYETLLTILFAFLFHFLPMNMVTPSHFTSSVMSN